MSIYMSEDEAILLREENSRLTAKLTQSKADKASAEKLLAIALDAAEAKAAELAATKAALEQAQQALRDVSSMADEQRRMFCCCNDGTKEATKIMRDFSEIAEKGLSNA